MQAYISWGLCCLKCCLVWLWAASAHFYYATFEHLKFADDCHVLCVAVRKRKALSHKAFFCLFSSIVCLHLDFFWTDISGIDKTLMFHITLVSWSFTFASSDVFDFLKCSRIRSHWFAQLSSWRLITCSYCCSFRLVSSRVLVFHLTSFGAKWECKI